MTFLTRFPFTIVFVCFFVANFSLNIYLSTGYHIHDLFQIGAMGPMVEGIPGGWRVVSHLFVHANFIHFFWNIGIFIYFAAVVEGFARTLLVPLFLISGTLASFTYLWSENAVWVGSSGGVFALIGAYIVLYRRFEESYKLRLVNPLVLGCIVVFTIILQAVFDSSWSAGCHLAGFVIGTALTPILVRLRRKHAQVLSVLCMSIMFLSFSIAIVVALSWTNEDSNSLSYDLLEEDNTAADIINQTVWKIANMNEGHPEPLITLATARQVTILPLDTNGGHYKDTLALLKESVGAQETGLSYRLEVLQTKMSRRYARIVATKMVKSKLSQFQSKNLSATLAKTNENGIRLVLKGPSHSKSLVWDINMKKMQGTLRLSYEEILQEIGL